MSWFHLTWKSVGPRGRNLACVAGRKHQGVYGIKRTPAVLIETLDTEWANELRRASEEICAAPLFWFTPSEFFTAEKPNANGKGTSPLFLQRPEVVLKKVWVTQAGEIAALNV